MRRFASVLGGPWRKLEVAARHVGHRWTGEAHRALADAMACRSVWEWMEGGATTRPTASPKASEAGRGCGAESDTNGYLMKVVRCPACEQRARVPRNKRMYVTCPGCKRVYAVMT